MTILAIDPGNDTAGVAEFDPSAFALVWSDTAADMPRLRVVLAEAAARPSPPLVVIEQMQSYGIAGSDLLATAAVYGRICECAESHGLVVVSYYRREVLRALDVTGKGSRDALVKHRICEAFGVTMKTAKGTTKDPGPLHVLVGHAWQALAVALAHHFAPKE